MIARFTRSARLWLSDAVTAAATLAPAIAAFCERWLSDAYAPNGEPEFGVAVRQAIFIGAPAVMIAVLLMAVLP